VTSSTHGSAGCSVAAAPGAAAPASSLPGELGLGLAFLGLRRRKRR
jgi:hypothetical protein